MSHKGKWRERERALQVIQCPGGKAWGAYSMEQIFVRFSTFQKWPFETRQETNKKMFFLIYFEYERSVLGRILNITDVELILLRSTHSLLMSATRRRCCKTSLTPRGRIYSSNMIKMRDK
jgi:hypothetical protein